MQKIIDAEKSDLFDVLAHVAYALPPLTREERAQNAKVAISTHFNAKQQAFLDFVLSHYVSVGVEELDQEKLTPLLRLKYHNSIADAVADLGQAGGDRAESLRASRSISTKRRRESWKMVEGARLHSSANDWRSGSNSLLPISWRGL